MLSLHHFNVLGYNSTSIVMFECFYCYLSSAVIFFSHLSFCNCKGSTAENCSEEASRFGKRNVKPINKLIGSSKWLWTTIPMNATRPVFSLKTLNCYDIFYKGGGLEFKGNFVFAWKMSHSGSVLVKWCDLRVGSHRSSRWVIFMIFSEKIAILAPFESNFAQFWSHLTN